MPQLELQGLLKFIAMSHSRFNHGLDRTPDDRLNWRSTPEAPSALESAIRVSHFFSNAAHYISTGQFPERGAPPVVTSREEARALVNTAFAGLSAAIAGVTDADLERLVMAPWGGQVPLRQMIWFVPAALGYYQGQLNYIQLAYGDTDPNMPPNWGSESG